jgi:hypothetical protein
MYIVLTVHLDFICIKLFWILTLWHPHPTTGQVLQSSPTPDLISAQEEEELNSSCITCKLYNLPLQLIRGRF